MAKFNFTANFARLRLSSFFVCDAVDGIVTQLEDMHEAFEQLWIILSQVAKARLKKSKKDGDRLQADRRRPEFIHTSRRYHVENDKCQAADTEQDHACV